MLCVFGRSYGMLQYVSNPDKPMPPNIVIRRPVTPNHSQPPSDVTES
ncbi:MULTISPECIES: hypothetical protein [Paenibacillus]|nr:hypothetical protein [Paenibacillus odorifer]